jgi:SAM-dependent methyltransferase
MDVGTRMLVQMASARRFNRWMADTIAPYVTGSVLEAGAGIGNLTRYLFVPGTTYVAAEIDDAHLQHLRDHLGPQPGLTIAKCDLLDACDLNAYRSALDTVICLNVIEHIDDDVRALQNLRSCLKCGGRAIVLVPQGAAAFGSIDRVLGHHRRYSKHDLRHKMELSGFHVDRILQFNRATYPGWLLNSRILRRTTLSSTQLRIFDLLVPLWRRIDSFLPWPPASLIAIATRHDC